ncbi:ras family small GTPase [Naegleria gruberi]|uniref:Ras family small GTPase n=1 Tax=Naegleria gruberi TaxID=5762 RepID=D2VSV9_NAEGR|nr:ras family small GTPase [Naegleria gruberi]EFC40049.1 ras family small GTPase [Naegleria gruberi]|eukprot:XP_002672793.1 ras family small GTPase [Naegleria gruberi strain NEG-M]
MEVKLAIIGSGGVGKSCVTCRFISDSYSENYDPTIEDSYYKVTELENGQSCGFSILDTAGQEEFSSLRENWMKQADGFLLVFALNDKKSYENIEELYEQILRVKDVDDWPAIVLLGNKVDLAEENPELNRKVEKSTVEEWARKKNVSTITPKGIDYFECSALSGRNIKVAFQRAARYTLQHKGITLNPFGEKILSSTTPSGEVDGQFATISTFGADSSSSAEQVSKKTSLEKVSSPTTTVGRSSSLLFNFGSNNQQQQTDPTSPGGSSQVSRKSTVKSSSPSKQEQQEQPHTTSNKKKCVIL